MTICKTLDKANTAPSSPVIQLKDLSLFKWRIPKDFVKIENKEKMIGP